ncbi:MAG: VIT1/CCC1 transporter family protein [Candidatus Aenigmarchaeota archaeon]|nr:VIT1/CCC1 transporter family protein [Candidatus Aenigmarchaeota archaeon]
MGIFSFSRANIKDFILGFQDGVVNVLGILLGVAIATNDTRIVLIAGTAGLFAESVSMAAVAYTSSSAAKSYYDSQLHSERMEIRHRPWEGVEEIRDIYRKKGFRGKELDMVVKKITSNKRVWLETMMTEELKLSREDYESPVKNTFLVGAATFAGSFVPLAPFLAMAPKEGIIVSSLLSVAALFAVGAVKAKLTIGGWLRSGTQIAVIGMVAALLGYVIGILFGA